MTLRREVLRNSIGTLLLRGTTYGVRVLGILVLARRASPEHFGTVALLMSAVEVARVLADFGVDTHAIRLMAVEKGEKLAHGLGGIIVLKVGASLLVGLPLLAVLLWLGSAHPFDAVMVWPLALTPLLVTFGANYLIATQQAHREAWRVIGLTALAVAGLALLNRETAAVGPTFGLIVVYEVLIGGYLSVRALRGLEVRPIPSLASAWVVLREAAPLGAAIAIGLSYARLDVFVIDRICGRIALAPYSFWQRLLEPFTFLTGVVAVTAYGHVSRAWHDSGGSGAVRVTKRYWLLSAGVAGTVALAVALLGDRIPRLIGPSYVGTSTLGMILGVLLILRATNSLLTSLLQAGGRGQAVMWISMWNLVVACLAVVGGTLAFGVIGAAVGLVAMEAGNTLVQGSIVRRSLQPKRLA
jgi:O-antigen/teichoic acid export membrane protein